MREEIETIVEGELGDPRIGLASVTAVEIAEDSRSARVYVSVEGSEEDAARSLEGPTAAAGFIRPQVAEDHHARRPPALSFPLDPFPNYRPPTDERLKRRQ